MISKPFELAARLANPKISTAPPRRLSTEAGFPYHLSIKYIRDKRSPVPKNETVSRVMSANRAKDSKPEVALRNALWHAGLRGYRLHYKRVPGRPDISYVGKKLAIFVHGCFWHRCPKCDYKIPKNNAEFWQAKFDRNVARDQKKAEDLRNIGWTVITVWECEMKTDLSGILSSVQIALN